ncbi:hypothetical protein [Spirosoma sordidisoli]|uniref:Uncharacterized protein n=1 Tax=Spirosoma sordidisoli TaxID=2502893 RepID=A0A4Q2US86_9BACT|nr:hypothetical protein [Spirosoma sordidisoli]RYC70731.1 hypothetical protein EQG79_00835 [Spirosoma sordidisoli]
MKNLLTTKNWGCPDTWPIDAAIVAEAAWNLADTAERLHGCSLREADVSKSYGREFAGVDLLLAVPQLAGTMRFPKAVLWLIRNEVLQSVDVLNWDTLFIPSLFIEDQQEAYRTLRTRTNRLADLLIAAHLHYTDAQREARVSIGLSHTYFANIKAMRKEKQYYRLQRLAIAWLKAGAIDLELWGERLAAGKDSLLDLTYAR